jgi:hypothetical protein
MKLSLTIILFIGLCFSGRTQEKNTELLKSYTPHELDEIQQVSQEQYALLVYALDNGLYTTAYHPEKHSGLKKVSLDTDKKAPLFTDFHFKITETNQYFYWENRNKVVVIKSFWVLSHEKNSKL